VFNIGKEFILIDSKGKTIERHMIPKEIETDFSLKGDFICYFSNDETLYQYNFQKQTNLKVLDIKYLKDRGIGVQNSDLSGSYIITEIDFDPKTEEYVFIVGPSFIYMSEKKTNKIPFSELNTRNYVYFNKIKNQMVCSDVAAEFWNPLLSYRNTILLSTPAGPIVFDKVQKKVILLYKEIFNSPGGKSIYYKYFINKDNLIFFEIANPSSYIKEKKWKISKVVSVDLKTNQLKNLKSGENDLLLQLEPGELIEDLSLKTNSILISKDKNVLYLYSLEKKTKKKIIELDENIGKAFLKKR